MDSARVRARTRTDRNLTEDCGSARETRGFVNNAVCASPNSQA